MNTPNEHAETETNLSDYEKEWASEEATPAESPMEPEVEHKGEDEKSPEEEAATSEGAPEGSQEEAQEEDPSKAAESEQEDFLAGLNEAQREAFQKLERDRKADQGRVRVANNKQQTLEEELQTLRDENATLKKANTETTQFEQDHPEYAEDLKKLVGNNTTNNGTVTPEELVLAAHPDVVDLTESPEFSAWVAGQDEEVISAINGSQAAPFILALNKFKRDVQSEQKPAQEENTKPPAGLADVGGSSSIPDKRPLSSLSVEEQYDREWADEDI